MLEWFRQQVETAGGGSYQSLINDSLKQFIANRDPKIESVVRRVVREELKKASESRKRKAA